MTMTEADTTIEELGAAAASGAQGALPIAAGWDQVPTDAGSALPGAEARAVLGTAGPLRVLFVVDAALARHIQVGPPPAEDFLDGSGPVIDAAIASLAPHLGPVSIDGTEEVDPATALSTLGAEGQLTAIALTEAGSHRASIVVSVPMPAEAAPAPVAQPTAAEPSVRNLASVPSGLEMLHDVEMGVTAELGRTRMLVRDVLELRPGAVIELDRSVGSPVDVLVNGTLIARGEVVVIDEEFGIRITDVIGYEEDRSV
ncbi:MAG TPA: flagellar motor switch protein FliN [Acidimicrobiales bacterium]